MTLKYADRVVELTITTGTGSYSLAGARTGFTTFAAAMGVGHTCYYCCTNDVDWEVGLGTIESGALTRDSIVASSNGGSAVSWAEGSKEIFCTVPATVIDAAVPRVILPSRLTAVVDDELQLFYSGIIEAIDPYIYQREVSCAQGVDYARYFSYTPESGDVGTESFTIDLVGLTGDSISQGATTLDIVDHTGAPASNKNVLCIGDSLTAGGIWPQEFYRRLAESGGTPAGLNYGNITFIGNQSMASYAAQKFIGFSGWNVDRYRGAGSSKTARIVDVSGAELMVNGDFEATDGSPFGTWDESLGTGGQIAAETTIVHGGSTSAQLIYSDADAEYYPRLRQYITVTAETDYRLTLWTRGDGANCGRYRIYDVTNGAYITSPTSTGVTGTDWTKVIHDFTTPAGCVYLYLMLTCEAVDGTTAYFDDVSLTALHEKDGRDVGSVYADDNSNQWIVMDYDAAQVLLYRYNHTTALPASGTLTYVSGGNNEDDIDYASSTAAIESPFCDFTTGDYSISAWATRHSYTELHSLCIFLGWNTINSYIDDGHLEATWDSYITELDAFIDEFIAVFPGIEHIALFGLNTPNAEGSSYNYGSNSDRGKWLRTMRAVNGLNQSLDTYVSDTWPSIGRFVHVASQFDVEHNVSLSDVPVNARNSATESRCTNGVHPATEGYYQIADAAYREFVRMFCSS